MLKNRRADAAVQEGVAHHLPGHEVRPSGQSANSAVSMRPSNRSAANSATLIEQQRLGDGRKSGMNAA